MDESDFTDLVRTDFRKWQSAALRITGNCADADDAVQTALATAWKKRGLFPEKSRFAAYIYGIVIHKAVDLVRSDSARHTREKDWQTPCPAQDYDVLHEGIAKLPKTYAQAVIAMLENGMKYAEAAGDLGWTEKLLYSRMHRAKSLLAGILSGRGKTSSGHSA